MSLTKNKMVREIGQRTRLKNREVQFVLETLMDVWSEELIAGGRIELENFIVLETTTVDRGVRPGVLNNHQVAPRYIRRISLRVSKHLKAAINKRNERGIDESTVHTIKENGRTLKLHTFDFEDS